MKGVMAHVERAAGYVNRARQGWNSSVLSQCGACVADLQQAEAALRAAQQEAGTGKKREAAVRLMEVRRDLDMLSHLVDAAMAFHRGLALHSGDTVRTEG